MGIARSVTTSRQVRLVKGLLAWLVLSTTAVALLNAGQRAHRAVIGMGCGLIVLWVFVGGALMVRFREPLARGMRAIPLPGWLRFAVCATVLALLEEAITVGMTNLAPLFGVRVGEAYITASANYWDVVSHHSVIVFVPLFIGWGLLLSKLPFSAFHVFLIFGITGTLAEASFSGPQALGAFGMWIFIYGLMVWLPTVAMSEPRHPWRLRWWMFPAAVFVPFLFEAPWALLMGLFLTPHPKLHFPPLS